MFNYKFITVVVRKLPQNNVYRKRDQNESEIELFLNDNSYENDAESSFQANSLPLNGSSMQSSPVLVANKVASECRFYADERNLLKIVFHHHL